MPNMLSKLFAGQFGMQLCHAECMELSHTWNPSCLLAIRDALGPSWLFCLKTYGSLYLLKAIVEKHGNLHRIEWKKFLLKTLRSSLFLTTTEIFFMLWLCALRRLLGFAIWPTVSYVNGFMACFTTIWIESKQRRSMLIPYLLNLATEAAYRQGVKRNIVRPIAYANSLVFGVSIGIIASFALNHQDSQIPSTENDHYNKSIAFIQSVLQQSHGIIVRQNKKEYGSNYETTRQSKRGKFQSSINKSIKLASRNFIISFATLSLYRIIKGFFIVSDKRQRIVTNIWQSFRLPLFLGSMPLFNSFFIQLCNYISSWSRSTKRIATNSHQNLHWQQSLSIGLSSLLTMAMFWPNNTLALYAFWKMVEIVYNRLVLSHLLPVLPGGNALLFSLVSSYLLSLAVLEPKSLRPSYYKFLCSLTGNRLQFFNRPLFDKYFMSNSCCGFQSSDEIKQPITLLPSTLLTINPALYSK